MNAATRRSPGCNRGRYSIRHRNNSARCSRQSEITLEEAKDRLTIPSLWAWLDLPGKPGTSCRSPFREDRKPSFSVYDNGRKWKDHATGEGGDAADFLAHALGVSPEDGCQKLIEFAGGYRAHVPALRPIYRAAAASDTGEKTAKQAGWPAFEKPTGAEISAVAELRGLSVEGVSLAAERGLLWCCDSREGRAWVVTDSSRRNAQARLLTGQPWADGMKCKTLPGSEAAWPVGLPESLPFPVIALVEGSSDLLAALHLSWVAGADDRIAPVAMLGASLSLPAMALPDFAGKRVRLFPDADKAGQAAGARLAAQLLAAGVNVDGHCFDGLTRADGEPVKDLNDFAHVCADQWESEREVIEAAFSFSGKEGR